MSRAPFPKNPRKTLRQHRNTRRLIVRHASNGDGTTTVTYLDQIAGMPDSEVIADDDCIETFNSWCHMVEGDWMLSGYTRLFSAGRKHGTRLDVSKMADSTAEWQEKSYWQGGMVDGAHLKFENFDTLVAWTAKKGIAPKGWTVDWFGGWVPVGDRRARFDVASRPCTELDCGRPCKDDLTLCAIHENGRAKREANTIRWNAEYDARRERDRERQRSLQAAEMWADRIRSDFNIQAVASSSGVALNGEGLHGLLAAVSVELRELGINLDDLIGRELRIDDTVES